MPYCKRCNKDYPVGVFCSNCGEKLVCEDERMDSKVSHGEIACPCCGSLTNPPGWAVCQACGTPSPKRAASPAEALADHPHAMNQFSLLIEAALADGMISLAEQAFLLKKGQELGLEESVITSMLQQVTPFMEQNMASSASRKVEKVTAKILHEFSQNNELDECSTLFSAALLNMDEGCPLYIYKMLSLGMSCLQICKDIILCVGGLLRDDSSFYVMPFFDVKKLKNAEFIPDSLRKNNKILFYYDSTIFGGGDEGFALSASALYLSVSSNKIYMIPYSIISDVYAKNSSIYVVCNNCDHIDINMRHDKQKKIIFLLKMLSHACYAAHSGSDFSGQVRKENLILLDSAIKEMDVDRCVNYSCRLIDIAENKSYIAKYILFKFGNIVSDDSSFYACPVYNRKKINNALFFNNAVVKDDDVLIYYDATFLGRGDDGFVLTSETLYSSTDCLSSIDYKDIDSIQKSEKSSNILVNDNKISLSIKEHVDRVLFILKVMSSIWKYTPRTI